MSDKTGISWTDATWNPIRGCRRVSPGCQNCYAERVAARFSGPGQPYEGLAKMLPGGIPNAPGPRARWTGVVRMVPEHLADPLRWKRPRTIFVNSMSDLFHEALTNEQIAAVFGVMAASHWHTFQVLTKRAERMRDWFRWAASGVGCVPAVLARLLDAAVENLGEHYTTIPTRPAPPRPIVWPLPNVWIGVSVEDQERADERVPLLLETPAAVRFLSCEPLLGPVALREKWLLGRFIECLDETQDEATDPCMGCSALPGPECGAVRGPRISWVIAGCESGPGARPCEVAWLRSLRDQCSAAGVPFFLKQARESAVRDQHGIREDDSSVRAFAGSKRKAGGVIELPYLDGVQHAAMPEVR